MVDDGAMSLDLTVIIYLLKFVDLTVSYIFTEIFRAINVDQRGDDLPLSIHC